jgi:hypothetical protein
MRESELQSPYRTRVLPASLVRQAAILFQEMPRMMSTSSVRSCSGRSGSYFEWSRRSLEVTARYGHVICRAATWHASNMNR